MRLTVCLATLLLMQLVAATAAAAPGDLDSDFSDDGIVITDIADGEDEGQAVAIDAKGRIVVAGSTQTSTGSDVLVLRYLPDGTLDPSFGQNGLVTTHIGQHVSTHGLAIDGQGRILVAALYSSLIRYQSDGTLDPTFGDSGIATIDMLQPVSLAIDTDRNILVAGIAEVWPTHVSQVVRYTPDGSIDSGFGDNGAVTIPGMDLAWSVEIDGQSRIVVGGSDFIEFEHHDGVVARYLPSGDRDRSFAEDGVTVIDLPDSLFVSDLALDDDDNIVITGQGKVLRLSPDGRLDTSFATNGVATPELGGHGFQPNSVAADRHGNIVIAGSVDSDFAVARYRPDGTLDSNFSGDGIVTTHISDQIDAANAVAIDEEGNIVLAGFGTVDDTVPVTNDRYIVVARYDGYRPDDRFVDDDDSIFQSDIEWLAAEGITKGCNPPLNDMFCPDDHVTRGQMAAFLVRALGYTDSGGGDVFVDDDDSVFEAAIDKLSTAGVTKGCNPPTNDRFCPNDFVTRGQMAAFLVRALGYTDSGGGDLFVDDDDSIFEAAIDKLGTAGVTKGCNPPTNDRFCPDDFVTRAQTAAFLYRALKN